MAQPDVPNNIILFHYRASPFARRVCSYLAFRQIAYAECIQPPVMPRPDLAALGVQYRRTPSMAIGRDIYLDTRLIIARLEQLFPPSAEHPAFSRPETQGLARLLNKLAIDASLFGHAVAIIPPDSPTWTNEAFIKDRAGFMGKGWELGSLKKLRPEALVHCRECFDVVESLLADGREWVGGTEAPTLADLEGVWAIDWILTDLAAPEEYLGASQFPKVHAWWARFKAELQAAKSRAPKVVQLPGTDAVGAVLAADFSDQQLIVDSSDPVQIRKDAIVDLFPTDSGGFTHQDRGSLVKLTRDEVAIAVKPDRGERKVHLHAPRWSFRLQEVGSARL